MSAVEQPSKPPSAATDAGGLFIAILSLDGKIDDGLSEWLERISGKARVERFRYYHPVAYARNRAVERFLSTNCQRLWFLDQDITPPTDALDMLDTDGDLVSGLCFVPLTDRGLWRIVLNGYQLQKDDSLRPLIPDGRNLVLNVDAAGTGCLLIKRHVLEDARMKLPVDPLPRIPKRTESHIWTMDAPRFRCPSDSYGRPILGEDIDFTLRATRAGFSLKYDMRYIFSHRKLVDLLNVFGAIVRYSDEEQVAQ